MVIKIAEWWLDPSTADQNTACVRALARTRGHQSCPLSRGAYCAVVSAVLTNIMAPEMFEATGEWLASCQSYEGGFSALPGVEAHGGYTFCGFAAAVLLQKHRLIDIQSLLVCGMVIYYALVSVYCMI